MAYSGHYPACYMPKVLAGSLINFAINENTRNAHPNVPVPSRPSLMSYSSAADFSAAPKAT